MAKTNTMFVVRASIVQAGLITLNLAAVASFFFIQVGSVLLIIPAAILDVFYLISQEKVGTKPGAAQPSYKILITVLMVVFTCLLIFTGIFLYQVYKTT